MPSLATKPSTSWSQPIEDMPGFSHAFATVEGVRLHYVCGGNPQGNTLVVLAGFPQSWFAWRKVMAQLADRYFILAPDLPGQGDSDKPLTGYDTLTLASKLHGLLQQLDIRHYSLAAHDVGAWVAWPFALRYRDQIAKLALLDAGIPGVTLADALAAFFA